MAVVSGYKNDIFISYTHDDNVRIGGKQGWVDKFQEALENWLKHRRGFKNLKIWRDENRMNRVTSVSFSADGKYIASGSNDESVRLWDVPPYLLFLENGKSTPLLNVFFQGATFFWQVQQDGMEFKQRKITPTIFPHEDYYFVYDKKFRPLLNPPLPDQSKFDQILEWAKSQLLKDEQNLKR